MTSRLDVPALIGDLNSDGLYVTDALTMWPDHEKERAALTQEAQAFSQSDLIDTARLAIKLNCELPGFQKPHMLKRPRRTLQFSDPLVWLGYLMVPLADGYFGEDALLFRADIHVTLPMRPHAGRVLSQRWHRDRESPIFFKVLWFISDLTPENGSFDYVVGTSRNRRLELCPQQAYPDVLVGGMTYLKAPGVSACPSQDEIRTVTGPANTVIVADTSGVHRGGYATGAMRLHVMWTFVPASSGLTTTIVTEAGPA